MTKVKPFNMFGLRVIETPTVKQIYCFIKHTALERVSGENG